MRMRRTRSSLKMAARVALTLLCAALAASSGVGASGVFELELVKLEQLLDQRPQAAGNGDSIGQLAERPVRVLVCLKEAFTSQLDGPCTFGNASLTLAKRAHRPAGQHAQPLDLEQLQPDKNSAPPAPLTNIVRILFTFRWTKSFTIILTAEQIELPDKARPVDSRAELQASNGTAGSRPASVNSSLAGPKALLIDRHVLTENEVVPNLDLNPHKPWASRFSRSLKSSLAYRFRVFCALNYYGDGCTTFCRARDDQFGHFNCSSTGQKLCLDGWSGPDCDKARCTAGCNLSHGFCDKPDTCQCRPGWTGRRCDECITYPGCQSGYCLSPWQCICQRNWGGVLCDQDLNFCGTHEPCKNNGTCQNIAPGRYKCACPDGFAGVDCDINLASLPGPGSSGAPLTQLSAGCALNPCLNGGTCFGFNSQLVEAGAESPPGPLLLPANQEQPEQGVVGSEVRVYRCQCPAGWTGDYCQWFDSAPFAMTSLLLASNDSLEAPTPDPDVQGATQPQPQPQPQTPDRPLLEPTMAAPTTPASSDNSHTIHYTSFAMLDEGPNEPESRGQARHAHLVSMKHIISWVLVASVLGVLLAAALLGWCCLIAIKQNRFSLIQMNIIRGSSAGSLEAGAQMGSTLRRMQEKIRDSLRASMRNRIKPETRFSIENVLRQPRPPPPSYEESAGSGPQTAAAYVTKLDIRLDQAKKQGNKSDSNIVNQWTTCTDKNNNHQQSYPAAPQTQTGVTVAGLVTRGALESKLAQASNHRHNPHYEPSTSSSWSDEDEEDGDGSSSVADDQASTHVVEQPSLAHITCPRHGHLYRHIQPQQQFYPQQEHITNHYIHSHRAHYIDPGDIIAPDELGSSTIGATT